MTTPTAHLVKDMLGMSDPQPERFALAHLDIEAGVSRPGLLFGTLLGFTLADLTAFDPVINRVGNRHLLGAPIARRPLRLTRLAVRPACLGIRRLYAILRLVLPTTRVFLIAERLRQARLILVLYRLAFLPRRLTTRRTRAVARPLVQLFSGFLQVGKQLRREFDQILMAQRADVGLIDLT